MQFQSLGVLLWFLPVAGFIILLYLLKVRRREVRVPAKFLFPAMTTDVRANALFQKLRPNLLLFLQLLAALLLLTALARPMIQAKGLPGQSVIVVDNSASMSSIDASPTRLDAAKNRMRRFVQELNPGEQLAIIEAGAQVRVLSPLTSDKQKLLNAIDQIQPTDTAGNLDEALRLAAALVGKSSESRIVLLSDGAFPPSATSRQAMRNWYLNRWVAAAKTLRLLRWMCRNAVVASSGSWASATSAVRAGRRFWSSTRTVNSSTRVRSR